jgi:hypothetical protein
MSILGKEFDQFTGLKTTYGSEDGKFKIHYEQDVQPAYDRLRKLRDEDGYKKNGIKEGFMHALSIQPVDVMRMLTEDGFNVMSASADEILSFCRRNKDKYGHCFAARGNI